MKKLALLLFILAQSVFSTAQSNYFPPLTGSSWDSVSASSLGWCDDKIDSLYSMLEAENSKAFIVLKEGKIVLEKYFGSFTKDSIWYWASAGKTLTAALVGIAQQEGYLHIDSNTSKYIGTGWSSAPLNKEKLITIKNQLTMTSGFDDGVIDNHCTIDTCLQYLSDAGDRWAYHNAPYTLLDTVIESATSQNFNTYFNAKIRNKIGMNGLWLNLDFDHVYFSNARSFARYGLLLLNKGKWNNTSVLNDSVYFNNMTNTSQNLNYSYGYLTWLNGKTSYMVPGSQFVLMGEILPHAPNDMYMALGKNGQFINVVPSQKLVLIRMGNTPSDNNPVPFLLNDKIWTWMNKVMCQQASIQTTDVSEISIAPNPFDDFIEIKSSEPISYCELYSEIGELVQIDYSKHISTATLPPGFYYLKVRTNRTIKLLKMLKK